MAAGILNFIVGNNEDFSEVLRWSTCDDGNKVPVDLTGYTAKMSLADAIPPGTTYHTLSTSNSEIVLGGAAGTITLFIPEATMHGFTFTKAYYDLILTSQDNKVKKLLKGIFQRDLGVTTP